jgi:hypothetical protein
MRNIGLVAVMIACVPVAIVSIVMSSLGGSQAGVIVTLVVFGLLARYIIKRVGSAEPEVEAKAPELPRFDEGAVWTPAQHFDLMLRAKKEIGRIEGAARTMSDSRVRQQFLDLAQTAETTVVRLVDEPHRLGFARDLLSTHLPRTAELAESYHLATGQASNGAERKAALIDVLGRLREAMLTSEDRMKGPELLRLDATLKMLAGDLPTAPPAIEQRTAIDPIGDVLNRAKARRT